MNYIKQLQRDRLTFETESNELNKGINELIGYLCSSKFHDDTTVQAADVIRRLRDIQSAATRDSTDVWNRFLAQ
jgi:hypothetical protein